MDLLHHSFGFNLFCHYLGIVFQHFRKLCLAKDDWWGSNTWSAQMIHINPVLKMVYLSQDNTFWYFLISQNATRYFCSICPGTGRPDTQPDRPITVWLRHGSVPQPEDQAGADGGLPRGGHGYGDRGAPPLHQRHGDGPGALRHHGDWWKS